MTKRICDRTSNTFSQTKAPIIIIVYEILRMRFLTTKKMRGSAKKVRRVWWMNIEMIVVDQFLSGSRRHQ